ncbi:MAG: ribonuclease D [Coriobacteriia bacterium]|nr:ribonuclease D [Coriobacteriia bacterium]
MSAATLVTTAAELDAALTRLITAKVVAIDTEFMREKTYYPQLCLLQIAADDQVFLIDPLPQQLDLFPLARLWTDSSIVKVFHAGIQDLQILFDACGVAVRSYFDTQDAATLIGLPEQIGYAALVKRLLDVDLDKADSFTDWSRRPLSPAQLDYATQDVTWLLRLYPVILEKLAALGRLFWLDEEFDQRCRPEVLSIDVGSVYLRLKRVSSLKPQQLAVAREVAAWREMQAMRKNIPKRWLLSDEAVLDIARRAPTSEAGLASLRGVGPNLKHSLSDIVRAVKAGKDCPADAWPQLIERRKLSGDEHAALELMTAIVRKCAAENLLASSVLASRSVLEDYLTCRSDDCVIMQGWRKDLIGNQLERLLAGKLALRLADGALVVEDLDV